MPGKLHFLDRGNGPAVLLIHAFPLDHTMWEPQIEPLTRHYRVIAPDIRGFGGSLPPYPWTIEEMCGDLNALLDSLAVTECAVAGVSLGGYIALPFQAQYPDRVSRLALANTRARADNETEKAARNDMIAAIQQHGASILPDRMLPRLLKSNPRTEVVRMVRGMIGQVDPAAAMYAVMAMRDRPDSSTTLRRIHCPVLVVTGQEDAIIRPEESRVMAGSIAGARFVEIPDSGHLSSLENPQEFNRSLLDFLLS